VLMPDSSNFISELSWDAYADRLARGATVLVPVGSNEQHGHHMPLGTDTLEVVGACRVAATHMDAVIAPALPFGYTSQVRSSGGDHWPGNISLTGATLTAVVRDVLTSLVGHGAERIAVVDAHYENGWFLVDACELVAREIVASGSRARLVRIMCWDAISQPVWDRVHAASGGVDLSLAHAGVLEAAAMLALAPEQVDMGRVSPDDFVEFPPYDVYPADLTTVPTAGALSSADGATAELGEVILADMGLHLARHLEAAFGLRAAG
jgi:creatinine amidohydrolase